MRRLGARIASLATWGARGYLAVIAGLLAVAVLPLLVGWRGNLIVSNSMAPSMPAGTVLMTSTPGDADPPRPGDVVVVSDPSVAGGALAHRVVKRNPGGKLILRGDANPTPDGRPVAADDVRGVARVAVPYVGLPALWVRERRVLPLIAWIVLTAGAIAFVTRPGATRPRRTSRGRRAVARAV